MTDPRPIRTQPLATTSERHPHEPEIPPTVDAEGSCLVCGLLVALSEAETQRDGYRADLGQISAMLLPDEGPPVQGVHAMLDELRIARERAAFFEASARTYYAALGKVMEFGESLCASDDDHERLIGTNVCEAARVVAEQEEAESDAV